VSLETEFFNGRKVREFNFLFGKDLWKVDEVKNSVS
jgi:hypothetical protein